MEDNFVEYALRKAKVEYKIDIAKESFSSFRERINAIKDIDAEYKSEIIKYLNELESDLKTQIPLDEAIEIWNGKSI